MLLAMRKISAIVACLNFLLVAVAVAWLISYWRGLEPTLVLQLPVEQCTNLFFREYGGWATGPKVDTLCRENGVSGGPLFAVRGAVAVRFVPTQFHGVKGELKTSKADDGLVYFYRYEQRYQYGIIEVP